MIITLDADSVPDDIQLPEQGWETILWLRSWSDDSEEVYFHRIVINRVETDEGTIQYQAHFQLYRNDDLRRYDLLEEMAEHY